MSVIGIHNVGKFNIDIFNKVYDSELKPLVSKTNSFIITYNKEWTSTLYWWILNWYDCKLKIDGRQYISIVSNEDIIDNNILVCDIIKQEYDNPLAYLAEHAGCLLTDIGLT